MTPVTFDHRVGGVCGEGVPLPLAPVKHADRERCRPGAWFRDRPLPRPAPVKKNLTPSPKPSKRVTIPKAPKVKAEGPRACWARDHAAEVAMRYLEGETIKSLSLDFGVSNVAIRNAVKFGGGEIRPRGANRER